MSPGVRRMPAPIMFPTVTARPNVTPRTVSSFARGKNVSVADAENGCAVRHSLRPSRKEATLSDPDAEKFAGIQQQRAVQQLRRHVDEFMSIDDEGLREEELYHRVLAAVHQLCAAILACE